MIEQFLNKLFQNDIWCIYYFITLIIFVIGRCITNRRFDLFSNVVGNLFIGLFVAWIVVPFWIIAAKLIFGYLDGFRHK